MPQDAQCPHGLLPFVEQWAPLTMNLEQNGYVYPAAILYSAQDKVATWFYWVSFGLLSGI